MILLDEPLSNLDAKVRARVRTELKTLLERIGITAVYVTHDQEEAFVVSDHIAVMNHGELVQLGSPNEIYSRPRNSFVADFIGRANLFDAEVKDVSKTGLVIEIAGLGSYVSTEQYPESAKLEKFLVSVRPEAVRLHRSLPANQTNVAAGVIEHEENRGATIDHQIMIGDQHLTSMTLNSVQFSRGDKVYVEIPPEAIKIIPK
jgi:iron(III) transport system ATP-binding protein